jgi:hypothetical protein
VRVDLRFYSPDFAALMALQEGSATRGPLTLMLEREPLDDALALFVREDDDGVSSHSNDSLAHIGPDADDDSDDDSNAGV